MDPRSNSFMRYMGAHEYPEDTGPFSSPLTGPHRNQACLCKNHSEQRKIDEHFADLSMDDSGYHHEFPGPPLPQVSAETAIQQQLAQLRLTDTTSTTTTTTTTATLPQTPSTQHFPQAQLPLPEVSCHGCGQSLHRIYQSVAERLFAASDMGVENRRRFFIHQELVGPPQLCSVCEVALHHREQEQAGESAHIPPSLTSETTATTSSNWGSGYEEWKWVWDQNRNDWVAAFAGPGSQ